MGETERQLAKTFFFFALQGIRRQYAKVEVAFVAHSAEAWEFNEAQFFQTSGTGGTVSSTVFKLSKEIIKQRYDPSQYNVYLFYASDGENLVDDRELATDALRDVCVGLTTAWSSRSDRHTGSHLKPNGRHLRAHARAITCRSAWRA